MLFIHGGIMQFTIDREAPQARICFNGRLDVAGAEVIGIPLAALSGACHSLEVDMAGVDFVSSIGLRQLLTAAKVLGRNGGQFHLVNTRPQVAEVITVAGLADLLNMR
jgi:anti-anti-sigma factor